MLHKLSEEESGDITLFQQESVISKINESKKQLEQKIQQANIELGSLQGQIKV